MTSSSVIVRDAARSDFDRGAPEIGLDALGGWSAEPGAAVRLLDAHREGIGLGVADPERGVVRIWSHTPLEAFNASFFRGRIESAVRRRKDLGIPPITEAYRLLHGDAEGLSGVTVDVWGEFLVVQAFGSGPARWLDVIEAPLQRLVRPRGIVRKLVVPEEAAAPRERGKVSECVSHGEPPPESMVVFEGGVPFVVRLLGSRHTGFFADMRDERRRLGGVVRGLRVLNTFAYTGAFSVAAALGGAAEVVTVDTVANVLEWAKENFRLAGIAPAAHHFVRMDTIEYLATAKRKGWRFGAVVLDPPTVSTGRGSAWSLRRDYAQLVAGAVEVLDPGGWLWAAVNTSSVEAHELDAWIEEGARATGCRLTAVLSAGQPPDFPVIPQWPRSRYLKIRVLRKEVDGSGSVASSGRRS